MKIFRRVLVLVVITTAILVPILIIQAKLTPKIYQNSDHRLDLGNSNIEIATTSETPIHIKAYSTTYFQFKKDENILYSVPLPKPIPGWKHETCFEINSLISAGFWVGSDNVSITANIFSEENIILTTTFHNPANFIEETWFLSIFIAIVFLFYLGFKISTHPH